MRPILVLTVAALLSVPFAADAKLTRVGAPSIQFLAVGPAGMKINGTSSELSADESEGKLTVTVPLTNLKTGIGLRDNHLRGYLNTKQHPNAKLVVERSKLKLPEDGKTTDGSATGDFTLNGQTKPLKFRYRAKRTGSDFHVQGMADVNIEHYGIEQPCYLGVCVEPTIKLKVAFKLRDK
ncbi:MAG TPA: YceI family protein [Polyangiaceae bacterium]|nr:YceI family protein [Polyangiaceae bacterium]